MADTILDTARSSTLRIFSYVSIPAIVLILLMMIVIPLPPFLLDFFFAFNIACSLIILMTAVYVGKPLEFAVFPTVLLVMTLLRLALNVASTRVVLMSGHTGTEAAGKVIEAFGQFVVGGDYSVGIVVFLILIIINFIVVTKGAERISEVTARFTLDALPGKQMAIDAELNAGMMNQETARSRRAEIARESSFYGAMDGASKFVKGDAIAGILILIINIVGGLAIGMLQHGLSATVAAQNYILLMIGDGLVAQIPSLMLSTAAAMIVTRAGDSKGVGSDIDTQLLGNYRVFAVTSAILALVGTIPAMPNLLFLSLSGILGFIAYSKYVAQAAASAALAQPEQVAPSISPDFGWQDVVNNEIIGLDLGYRLVALADKTDDDQSLLPKIKFLRKKISQECGFLLPEIHIRDDLNLSPNSYAITIHDVPVAQASVEVNRLMAINPGEVTDTIDGIKCKDPAFGLDAIWIEPQDKENAQLLGYTVVDPGSVIATHMTQVIRQHLHELIGHDDVQQLLDSLAASAPRLVENLVPKSIQLSTMLKVLQHLLEEQVPIKDFRTIAESLAGNAQKSQNPDDLTQYVRIAIGRSICQNLAGISEEIEVITLDAELEQFLLKIAQSDNGMMSLEPNLARWFADTLQALHRQRMQLGKPMIMLVSEEIRFWIYRFATRYLTGFHVLSHREIPAQRGIRVITSVTYPANR
jgi:flagellar biosynthesis protein FlhA